MKKAKVAVVRKIAVILFGLMGPPSNGGKPKLTDLYQQVPSLVHRAGDVPLGRWL
jgi:hypothetical protein